MATFSDLEKLLKIMVTHTNWLRSLGSGNRSLHLLISKASDSVYWLCFRDWKLSLPNAIMIIKEGILWVTAHLILD